MSRERTMFQRQAFTILEIMIIVAIIGLLAALAIPSFIKVRKQSQAKRIVNDARIIDTAIDSWSLEKGKADGDAVVVSELGEFTKSGVVQTTDVLGNAFIIGTVGTNQVQISATTKSALSDISVDWGAY